MNQLKFLFPILNEKPTIAILNDIENPPLDALYALHKFGRFASSKVSATDSQLFPVTTRVHNAGRD